MREGLARALACLAVAVGVALLAGCSDARLGAQAPADIASGLQLSGTVDGRQVAVRDGSPDLVVGDCDPRTPPDTDVCAISQTIGGELFVLVFENPDVLEAGAEVEVAGSRCRGPQCDEIADHAVVDVQFGGGPRLRARGGEVHLTTVEPFVRYTGRIRLELPGGRLAGDFDLVPRPE